MYPLVPLNNLFAIVDIYIAGSHTRIPIPHNEFIFGGIQHYEPYIMVLPDIHVTHHVHTIYLQFTLDFVLKVACMNIQLFSTNTNITMLLEPLNVHKNPSLLGMTL